MLTWMDGRDPADTYTRKKYADATLPGATSAGMQSTTPCNECHSIVDFTDAAWEAAFPGQAILPDGRANRQRRAMHCARAMVRAVAIDDIVVAEVFGRWMDRAYAPYRSKAGSS